MEYESREDCIPSDSDLLYLGFETWQMVQMRKLSIESQWVVYDEYLRILMEGDDALLDL